MTCMRVSLVDISMHNVCVANLDTRDIHEEVDINKYCSDDVSQSASTFFDYSLLAEMIQAASRK